MASTKKHWTYEQMQKDSDAVIKKLSCRVCHKVIIKSYITAMAAGISGGSCDCKSKARKLLNKKKRLRGLHRRLQRKTD